MFNEGIKVKRKAPIELLAQREILLDPKKCQKCKDDFYSRKYNVCFSCRYAEYLKTGVSYDR